MPWQEKHTMSLREEFVQQASKEGCNVRELCRRYGISAKTAYKWIGRYEAHGCQASALQDRSRRPATSPSRTNAALEDELVRLRERHPSWGGRKLSHVLRQACGISVAPSTVTSILHHHGLIEASASEQRKPCQRFEHDQPNALWQIDFKASVATLAGPCHPLTLLDDHSRFNLLLHANAKTDTAHVQPLLEQALRRYGMPLRINGDNGPPWGSPSAADHGLTRLTMWLIRMGIRVSHSRPYHPQTNGKLERFHRTLDVELLSQRHFTNHASVQRLFDTWRTSYNCQRPHEALGMQTPSERYRSSALSMPDRLPPIEYPNTDTVITVGWNGFIRLNHRRVRTCTSLHRLPIGLRPDPAIDGVFDVYFCHHRFMRLDFTQSPADS